MRAAGRVGAKGVGRESVKAEVVRSRQARTRNPDSTIDVC